jgi:adenine-specific DNA methylase
VFGSAFFWLRSAALGGSIRRALKLGVSHALTTNNRLCGYATDYGRLAPLFSVSSYSLPALSVELNPFHPTGGRGTLSRILRRVRDEDPYHVRRHVWSVTRRRPTAVSVQYTSLHAAASIRCESAAEPRETGEPRVDVCVTDPPYFDYIAYSELSEFYRCWLAQDSLGGTPLLPHPDDPVESFAKMLAPCLSSAVARLKPGRPLAFTYHATSEDAWAAIGKALDRARLLVTALWPIKNDAHMGHHTAAGNCEWDAVVVCRPIGDCTRSRAQFDLRAWAKSVRPISAADRRSLGHAIAMAASRYGVLTEVHHVTQSNSGDPALPRRAR